MGEACRQRQNVFFSGEAGTGKSIVLRAIIESFRSTWPSEPGTPARLGIVAPTGRAASCIGGFTIHRWSGLGIAQADPESQQDVSRVCSTIRLKKREALQRWQEVEVLVIDEISMVHARQFDLLHRVAQRLRRSEAPFGGIQLIVAGDFAQLPPVPRKEGGEKDDGGTPRYAFQSRHWAECLPTTQQFSLLQVHRQQDRGTWPDGVRGRG